MIYRDTLVVNVSAYIYKTTDQLMAQQGNMAYSISKHTKFMHFCNTYQLKYMDVVIFIVVH